MDNQDEPKTFDILRMNREVERRQRVKGYVRVTSGLALVGLGLARGRIIGIGIAVMGLNLLTKHLTGRSLWQHARAQLARPLIPRTRSTKFGNGLRDTVDEASWESFPASDPPGYSHGLN